MKVLHQLLAVSGFGAVVLIMSGCASAESGWSQAQKQDDERAYWQYINKYPDGPHASAARERIEQLDFQGAKRAGTPEAYADYLNQFPKGRNASDARQALAKLDFESALRAHSVKSYEAFIAKHPGDALTDQLRKDLPALRVREQQERVGELVLMLCPVCYVTAPVGFQVSSSGVIRGVQMGLVPLASGSALISREGVKTADDGNSRPQIKARASFKEIEAELTGLLKSGVDPNAIEIKGYVPLKRKLVDFSTEEVWAGKPGFVVPAGGGGVTLVEFCRANKFEDAGALLKSYGAK